MKPRPLLWIPALLSLAAAGAAVGLLWPKRLAPSQAAILSPAAAEPAPWAGGRARALLHLGRRVGRIDERERASGSDRVVETRTVLQVQRAGRRGFLERHLSATVSAEGALRSAELRAGALRTRARIGDAAARVAFEAGEQRFEHRVAAPAPLHVESTLFPWVVSRARVGGPPVRAALLDLEHGQAREVAVRLAEEPRWHGIPARRAIVHERSGVEWSAVLDAGGAVLEAESLIPGVGTRVFRPGDEERPLFAIDLGTWGRVVTSGEIREPSRVRRLRVRLRGLPPEMRLAEVQEITRRAIPDHAPSPPARPEPGPLIESDAPEIGELARALLPSGTSPAAAAARVTDWIRKNVRQGDAVGPPSALLTLRTRRGNCNEISALSAALLRAAGFDARIAVGAAYDQGAFRYHAWPQIRAGGEWYGFDPTFRQVPADATHLVVATGGIDAQTAVLHLSGRLTLHIEAVEEDGP